MIIAILTAVFYAVLGYYVVRAPVFFISQWKAKSDKNSKKSIMLIFGSGGHTTELLMTFKNFDFLKWQKIYFVKAETDVTSESKIKDYLSTNKVKIDMNQIEWITIPRSREVGQSYASSVITTLKSLFATYKKLLTIGRIDLTICNGPGTCVPVVAALYINWFLLLRMRTKVIFVESYCRVTSLSLTGKILYKIADRFLVHWPELVKKYPKAKYVGTII